MIRKYAQPRVAGGWITSPPRVGTGCEELDARPVRGADRVSGAIDAVVTGGRTVDLPVQRGSEPLTPSRSSGGKLVSGAG